MTATTSKSSDLYALLIGVDCYLRNQLPSGGWYPSLGGAVRDITMVEDFLRHSLSVRDDRITKLTATYTGPLPARDPDHDYKPTEPPENWPTYQNMVAAFEKVTKLAQAGDQVYIHYSGHGGRATTIYPELNKEAGLDEALVPTDIGNAETHYLRDVELAHLLQKMVDKGLLVTIVLDSCHSGGATRGLGAAIARGIEAIDTGHRPKDSEVASHAELLATWRRVATGGTRNLRLGSGWVLEPNGYTLFAAARAQESAFETLFDDGQYHGVLTYWLLDTLKARTSSTNYQAIYDRVLAKVHTQFEHQTPQLQGEGNRIAFSDMHLRPPLKVVVEQVEAGDPGRLLVRAGQVQGLRKGAQFVVYPPGVTDLTQIGERLALAKLTELGAESSWATITKKLRPEAIEPGAQAVVLDTGNVNPQRPVRLFKRDDIPASIDQTAALEKVRDALAETEMHFARLVTDDGPIAFQVTVNEQSEYEKWMSLWKSLIYTGLAIVLTRLLLRLIQQGHFKQALTIAHWDCKLGRKLIGEEDPGYAASLNYLAGLYDLMGNYTAAEPLYRQASDIRRKALGEEHPDYAQSLNNLADLYRAMGNYTAAEPLYRQASDIRRKALGEEHPDYAQSLNNLAMLYRDMGNYATAEPLIYQASDIQRKTLGEEHQDYAQSLNNLAKLYHMMGNYAAAEPLYRQDGDILRKARGKEDLGYGCSLNDLAMLYQDMGNYAAAEPLIRRASDIIRKALGEEHLAYATSLNNLAGLYQEMGNYVPTEPLYRRASDIRRKALSEKHPDYANSLNNLATLYQNMGNYAAAEPLIRQACDIFRKALGEEHPDYAQSLNNLAMLYRDMGNYAAAEPLLRQASDIRRKVLGEEHHHYATSLNNLAMLYQNMGNYAAAEPLIRQACDIFHKVLGEEHHDYAVSLNNLAELYRAMGNYTAAEPLYRQASDILRKALGEEHHECATSLDNLAWLCVATDRVPKAMALMLKAEAIDNQMIDQVFSISSEAQRMAYLTSRHGQIDAFLSLVLQYMPESPAVVAAALELVLRHKAIGAESLAAQRDAVLGGRYPALKAQLQELMTWRRQIAQKILAGPGPEGLAAHRQLLTAWSAHKERLEEELVRQIPEMNLERTLRAVDRQAVAEALPEHTALVEFVRCDIVDFKAVPARQEPRRRPAHYSAFVLPAGSPDNVQMIDLGDAKSIEQMIAGFRAALTGGDRTLRPVQLPTMMTANDGTALRRTLFDPIMPALAGCTRLFLAPDGDLARLPFETLPTADGRRLIDDYHFSYLSVGRDLLRIGATLPGQPAAPLVIADPNFDLGGEGTPAATGESGPLARQSRALNPAAIHFNPLPGTQVEGAQIAAQLGVQPWFKGAALEERLKTTLSPRILHIATHGFFLEDQERDPNQAPLGHATLAGSAESPFGRLGHAMENPLLRSGLALAGVNTWLAGKPLPAEAGDGLLHAEDVSGLDLIDTELVVLSACETGLGEIQVGEGVLGLRRAFVLAGAKTLVMSLWKVPDQQTQELMEEFYRRILEGEGRSDALRTAQLMMKAKYPNPLYWGAFICQGDPGSLRSDSLSHHRDGTIASPLSSSSEGALR